MSADYDIEHWTPSRTAVDSSKSNAVEISVKDRAATRLAIITRLRQKRYALRERSSWNAKPPRHALTASDWNYRDIVIPHAGHSYSCAMNEHDAIEQMKKVQSYDVDMQSFDDVGYHYAVSCPGELNEARDIRFTGSHVKGDNTGRIGIVLLENLAEAGEAWQQEHSRKSLWQSLKGALDIARDAVAFNHEMPPKTQIDALLVLIATLNEFFDIAALGGHREYQILAPSHEGRGCPGRYGMQVVTAMRARLGLAAPSK